ncbi:putative disease resistance protein RGA3 [Macadamia integrifolia]|uniref:putative disease resistance protein RGA3 n=1 Tax=Macadamia integrifolia TaxID=60698 RepID=UPI001C4FFACE|nr:putative disease resistance protein RGA3 [Macadamia integrifolia]
MERVVAWLLSVLYEKISVLPIVGIGGLGKTTLAQIVYNDHRVCQHFESRVWVSVGEAFDVAQIGKDIIESVTGRAFNLSGMESVGSSLLNLLAGRRFLIVFDDVWNEDLEKWNLLESWLSRCANGSKILVTTRSEKVAGMMSTTALLRLGLLSDYDCWSLFRHQAFIDTDVEGFFEIGKKAVSECKGLPLAVKSLGTLVSSRREAGTWLSVIATNMFTLQTVDECILPVLKLSYYHLPSHLKQCFAYCSIFPKDYAINKEKLIQLWMAEGFIQSPQGSRTLEDVGNDYIVDLLQRSFFIDVKEDDLGNMTEFKMHVFIHELAQSVSRMGSSIVEAGFVGKISESVCHASLICDSSLSTIPEALGKDKNLRTLLLLSAKDISRIPSNAFLNFRWLRVLDLSRTGIGKLSTSIGTLEHLRYLDLSHTHIKTLPESVVSLRYLQTLKLAGCCCLKELPEDIKEMTNLRHLDIWLCSILSRMPSGIGQLSSLQTLSTFILDQKNRCTVAELGNLNIRDKLEIKNLQYLRNLTDAREANLKDKQKLRSLGLTWGNDSDVSLESSYAVLHCLQPPSDLKELSIKGYGNIEFPLWKEDTLLLNLVKISLINCRNCKLLPQLGKLLFLKELYLKGMIALKSIGYDFYGNGVIRGFPSLEQLEFYDMPNLVEWLSLTETEEGSSSTATKAFPCLKTLVVQGCPKLTSLPLLPALKKLALWNSSEMVLCSVSKQTSLSSLGINEFEEISSFPKGSGELSSIEKLTIYNCQNLIYLLEEGLQALTSVKHLSIQYCNKLNSLSNGLRFLVSLQKLVLKECEELAFLPEVMQELPRLEELIIDACPKLASLPSDIQYLTSLQNLIIRKCPNLGCLPMGFENLSQLEYLFIAGCPQLERRLKEGGGDSEMIAHIPCVIFNDCNDQQGSVEYSESLKSQRSQTSLKHASKPEELMSLQLSTANSKFSFWNKIGAPLYALMQKGKALAAKRYSTSSEPVIVVEKFMLSQLSLATKNFSSEYKIWNDAYGTLYGGKLVDGREVAINRCTNDSGLTKYFSELHFLSRHHHKHLISLVGFCSDGGISLVFNYMENGTLFGLLHAENNIYRGISSFNSWPMRIKISLDAARGIEFLHKYADPPLIHRDIRSSNIWLDANWTAKLSGFHLAMNVSEEDSELEVFPVAGTLGYIDPEYAIQGFLTMKSDVYSFGIVLLELLTGRNVHKFFDDQEPTIELALQKILAGELDTVLDARVRIPGTNEAVALDLVADTAVQCVNKKGEERPTITGVLANLEKALALCNGRQGTHDRAVSHGSHGRQVSHGSHGSISSSLSGR